MLRVLGAATPASTAPAEPWTVLRAVATVLGRSPDLHVGAARSGGRAERIATESRRLGMCISRAIGAADERIAVVQLRRAAELPLADSP